MPAALLSDAASGEKHGIDLFCYREVTTENGTNNSEAVQVEQSFIFMSYTSLRNQRKVCLD